MENKDCIFCNIVSKSIESEVILETDNFLAVKDKFPLSEGHTLIISKKHYDNLLHAPNLLGTELFSLAKEIYLTVAKNLNVEGFNLVQNNFKAAGQTINHLHFHLIPRKQNDGVKLN